MPTGQISHFGADGWGLIASTGETGDAPTPVPFHSTALVDGTRMIDAGTTVGYRLVPGRQGRWEAADVEMVGSPP